MKTETDRGTQTPDDVLHELRALVGEAEKILGQAPERACTCDSSLDALRDRLEAARDRATEAYEKGKQRVVAGAKRADETIRSNPYQSLAIALGVGLIAGVLVGRRWNSGAP